MAFLGIGLFVSLVFIGDLLDIGILQSADGILIVLLVGGPLIFILALILLYILGDNFD